MSEAEIGRLAGVVLGVVIAWDMAKYVAFHVAEALKQVVFWAGQKWFGMKVHSCECGAMWMAKE